VAETGESKAFSVPATVSGAAALVLVLASRLLEDRARWLTFAAGTGILLVVVIVAAFRATQRDSKRSP
jgi:preprotein translocase subunit SecY